MRSSSVNHMILETLAHSSVHLTAQQVYETLRPRLPAVNASTVYRALERLANAGLVSVSDMGLGATVYEAVGEEKHHHLVCQNCHTVVTIDSQAVKNLFETLESQQGFQVITNHLVLFGLCPDCQIHFKKDQTG